jgi:hypothetical protein
MHEFAGRQLRVFVIWEPVLPTDWSAPSTAALRRVSDTRATQFWDKGRLVSHLMGEHDRDSIVWDYIAVYPPGAVWDDGPPEALYHGGPVVRVTERARSAVERSLAIENR